MATMYKRINGNWVASAPHIYGDAEIVPRVSTVNNMQIQYVRRWQTSSKTGSHLNTAIINSYKGKIIRIGYNSSIPLTFFAGASTGRNQSVYMIASNGITTETINGITYYTFALPATTYLFICFTSSGTGTNAIYEGVIPSSIVIKGDGKQWNSGDIYKFTNNYPYTNKGIQLSGTYISSVSDSLLSTYAARDWKVEGGGTYTVVLNGDWTTINGNGWDIFGYSFLSAGNSVYQTTKSDIVYDSITDTTTLSVTLSTGTSLVFAHPNSTVNNADVVLNSIDPQVLKSTGTWD